MVAPFNQKRTHCGEAERFTLKGHGYRTLGKSGRRFAIPDSDSGAIPAANRKPTVT